MTAQGCLGQLQDILSALSEGWEPPPEVVPPDEPRGLAVKTEPAVKDGAQHQVWRIRCTECAWFDHQWTRAEVKASYALHLAGHGAGTVRKHE